MLHGILQSGMLLDWQPCKWSVLPGKTGSRNRKMTRKSTFLQVAFLFYDGFFSKVDYLLVVVVETQGTSGIRGAGAADAGL